MGDAGIGQEALEIVLHKRHETAERHRHHRNDRDDDPGVRGCDQRVEEHPQDHREPRRLGAHRHEGGDRRRRAFIDVRHPHVERHRADLEDQPRDDEDHRQQQSGIERIAGHRRSHPVQLRRAGEPVDQRNAVKENPGRDPAKDHVFQRRFVRPPLLPQEAGQHIGAERHQFEAHIDRQEVGRRGHDHHSRKREEQQDIVFAAPDPFDLGISSRKKECQNGG